MLFVCFWMVLKKIKDLQKRKATKIKWLLSGGAKHRGWLVPANDQHGYLPASG
jgi:hypothetical protein